MPISFAEFTREALYGPNGYYRQDKKRVGKAPGTDFYTAYSLGPLFGALVAASLESLLGPRCFADYVFVEIGAEPGQGLFAKSSPFDQSLTLKLGQPLIIPPKAIVFSNELLDAQPFHRFRYTNGQWRELGVHDNQEVLLEHISSPAQAFVQKLPSRHIEGYCLDISLEAEQLLEGLLAQPWQGFFLTFDYGKTWESLLYDTPQGSARAYHGHKQQANLLENPGSCDLTCHVCWDRLEALMHHPTRQRQESFFMHHANQKIQNLITKAPPFDPTLQALKGLLLQMGSAFEALWAWKE